MSSAAEQAAQIAQEHGAPYPPQTQALGETPTVLPDVPISAVFLVLFIATGAGHMFMLKYNQRRGKKFILSGMMFGFCFTRIFANSLRIAWACHPTNVKLGIAENVGVYAGIILLFLGNLFFTQRIVRAQHPHIGWSKPFSIALPILFAVVVGTILALIVGVIYSFYTLKESSLRAVHDIQVYGETLYAVVAFLPIPIVTASCLGRRLPSVRDHVNVDKFGSGKMRTKVIIVLVSAVFLTLGAAWRASAVWLPPTYLPQAHPWYYSKACFYIFDFTIEWCVVTTWLLIRIDKRFHIPNGAKGPYSYGGGFTFAGEPGNEKIALGNRDSMRHLTGSTHSNINGSRVSWGGSRTSMARESRVSWGGISREDVSAGLAEDGVGIMPYSGFLDGEERNNASAADVGVDGAEAEMGWDPKSGRWALRPVSNAHFAAGRPVSTRSGI